MNQNKKIIAVLSSLLLSLVVIAHVTATNVQRSNFIVKNLSCTSCLANIEAELRGVPGALGMDADLRSGKVTVDHLSSLNYEQIAVIISKLGYSATTNWTATVPEQYTKRFAQQSPYSSGCSGSGGGGCGSSGGAGAGPTVWKTPPATGTINRTTLQVSNLSCSSCLSNIAAELSKLSNTYGMNGYLSRGIVIIDHEDSLENSRIAAIISDLGYPARVASTNEIKAQKGFTPNSKNSAANPSVRSGAGCGIKGPCNATSASWQKLYNRYFSKTNSK